MSKEAMKLALGKIKSARDCHPNAVNTLLFEAEEILEEALEKPDFWEGYVPEPVKAAQPVALKWQRAPIRTAWGDDMVVASVAIDNDHTLSLYCERDQAPKVDAMFAQRTWVGLSDEEIINVMPDDDTPMSLGEAFSVFAELIEAKLKEKNT